jgi:hypothetical protein
VKPQFLRFEESAVVAGTVKTLAYGKSSKEFHHSRDGDIEFLKQLENLMRNPCLNVQSIPEPEPYKKVRDPSQVEPRITGELVTRLKELGDFKPDEAVADGFQRNVRHFCEKSGDSYTFPMGHVNGRGLTLLDLSSVAGETYSLELDSMDSKSELFRFDLARTLRKAD